MPTYDYECAKCGNRFEVFQKMTAEPAAKCPKCGASSHRLISGGSGVIFKGSGFYETDYKRKKKPDDKNTRPCPKDAASDGCKNCPLDKEKK